MCELRILQRCLALQQGRCSGTAAVDAGTLGTMRLNLNRKECDVAYGQEGHGQCMASAQSMAGMHAGRYLVLHMYLLQATLHAA